MKKAYPIKTKYGLFRVLIWQDKHDDLYLVEIPSFSRAMTQGSTLAQAKRMAADLINLLSESAIKDDGKVVIDDTRRVYGGGKLATKTGPVSIVAWAYC